MTSWILIGSIFGRCLTTIQLIDKITARVYEVAHGFDWTVFLGIFMTITGREHEKKEDPQWWLPWQWPTARVNLWCRTAGRVNLFCYLWNHGENFKTGNCLKDFFFFRKIYSIVILCEKIFLRYSIHRSQHMVTKPGFLHVCTIVFTDKARLILIRSEVATCLLLFLKPNYFTLL